MPSRDLLLFFLIAIAWSINTVVSSYVLTPGSLTALGVPPLFFAALRFLVVALCTAPWLFPLPERSGRMLLIALLMGCGHFGLTYVGLRDATTASAGIVFQTAPPLIVLLSVWMFGERLSARRIVGICLALSGVLLTVYTPHGLSYSTGLLFIIGGQITFAVAAVMLKTITEISPMQFQAWTGSLSVPALFILSGFTETAQIPRAMDGGWILVAIGIYSGLIASVWAHGQFYSLMQRHAGSQVATFQLLPPVMTIGLGIWLRGDPFTVRLGIGAGLALAGVFLTNFGVGRGRKPTPDEALDSNVAT